MKNDMSQDIDEIRQQYRSDLDRLPELMARRAQRLYQAVGAVLSSHIERLEAAKHVGANLDLIEALNCDELASIVAELQRVPLTDAECIGNC